MPRSCYSIERSQGEWVVLASDTKVLRCKTKRIAQETTRCATTLLLAGQNPRALTERRMARVPGQPIIKSSLHDRWIIVRNCADHPPDSCVNWGALRVLPLFQLRILLVRVKGTF